MKHILYSLFALASVSVVANEESCNTDCCKEESCFSCLQVCSDKTSIEARVSYEAFASDDLKNAYDSGAANYGITAAVPLMWYDLNLWLGVDYLYASGHVSDVSTNIRIIPGTVGLKYMRPVCHFVPYLGAGLKWFWVDVHNHGAGFKSHFRRNAPGGVVEAGSQYVFDSGFLVDLFVNYSFATINGPKSTIPSISSSNLNVAAWNVGGAIGYRF